jgi:formylglycine-generating enzyme required for sulfatase activity
MLSCGEAQVPPPASPQQVEPPDDVAQPVAEAAATEEPPQKQPKNEPPSTAPDGTVIVACEEPPPGMACVAGGPFIRGSDDGPKNTRPQATVWLQTFYMDVYEVTNEDYKKCRAEQGCPRARPLYNDFFRPKQPLVGGDWNAAVKYCELQGKHLPTEAQWEKAARGPDGALHPWGDEPATCERAVIEDERGRSCGVRKKMEHPKKGRTFEVGTRPPGIYGLYDMSGNAWEWVADWASKDYAACGEACLGTDPTGPCEGKEPCRNHDQKVVRGGSWYWPAKYATGIWRRTHYPGNDPFHHFGFRCAASTDEAAKIR